MIVVWASTFLCIVVAPWITLGPVVAKESLGGAAAWGMIAAGWGAGSLGGGVLALRWKPGRPMFVCCALVLLIAPGDRAARAARAGACDRRRSGDRRPSGMGFFGAVWQTTLQQHVPEEALSRVSAWDWMGSFAFLPLGLILAGPVSDAIGISTTLWISVGYLVVSTLAVLLVPSVRNLRRLDEPEPTTGSGAPDAPGRAARGVPWLSSRATTSSARARRSAAGCIARRSSPRRPSASVPVRRST